MATSKRSGSSFSYPSEGDDERTEGRPVLGAGLLVVAGVLMLFVTYQFTMELLMLGSAFTVIGFIFGTLVILSGVLSLAAPELSTPIGMVGIALSILGIIGALGGLLVGTILGIAGGSLLIAWQPKPTSRQDEQLATTSKPVPADESGSFDWQRGGAGRTDETPTLEAEESQSVDVERPSPVESKDSSPVDVEEPSPLQNEEFGSPDRSTKPETSMSGADDREFGSPDRSSESETVASEWGEDDSLSTEEETEEQTSFAWEKDPEARESDN